MKYKTIIADPPWRFDNRTARSAPEYKKLFRYPTMNTEDICAMGPQILELAAPDSHLYLWVPTALLNWGLQVVASWGFDFKTSLYWHKITSAGISDRGCMGHYYRNVVEPCLFATRNNMPTHGKAVANLFSAQRTGHSIKPETFFDVVKSQSPGPYLELFARQSREGFDSWGNEIKTSVLITTNPDALEPWREVVRKALNISGGRASVQHLYELAEASGKVSRAKILGHKWQAQIRRTLQVHFKPCGNAVWAMS